MSVNVDDVRGQVDRIVRSKTFETSDVHRRLLNYLAEKTLSGEADRLKEYTIGLEAFGKPDSYDPRHDSIVRLQVSRLRQKLMAYYQTEANGDQVHIDLPKGAFKLSFEPIESPDWLSRQTAAVPTRWKVRLLAFTAAVAVAWAIVASVGLSQARREAAAAGNRWSPDLDALWAPVLATNRSLLVCLGTPMFVRFPSYGFFRDPRSNVWNEVERSERIGSLQKALGVNDVYPAYAFTGAGEASAAFLISSLLSTKKPHLLLTRSNLLSWQQVADHDVIFIGPPKFNLQLQAAALRQDIVIEADGIRNLKPRPGEPVYLPDRIVPGQSHDGETHAVISRTQGLSGAGELLVIAGNASPDTLAAAEWLTQPARARTLVQRLRLPSGQVPRYFQAVIKVTFKQGIPLQSSFVFHHVLEGSGEADSGRKSP